MLCDGVLSASADLIAGGKSVLVAVLSAVLVAVAAAKGFPTKCFSPVVCYALALINGDIVVAGLLGVVVAVRATGMGGTVMWRGVTAATVVVAVCCFGALSESESLPIAFLA